MDPAPPPRAPVPGRTELLLLAAALAARVAVALLSPTGLWFDHVFNDATARNLAAGNGFTASAEAPFVPGIFRTPGYPGFLAAVYAVAGPSVRAGFLANALLDALSCLLAWRLAARRLGPGPARWVLLVAATYPFTAQAVGTLSPESLLVFLCLLLLETLDGWPERGVGGAVIATGLLVGVLAWVKPVFLPLPAFLALWDRLRGRPLPGVAARAAVVTVLTVAVFAPWPLRNLREFGRPLLAGELGLVLWHGTRDFSEHRDREIKADFLRAPRKGEDRYEAMRRALADSPKVLEVDGDFLDGALREIAEHPVRAFVVDPLRRVPRLWVSTTHVQYAAWVGAAAAAACIAYLALAVAGALLLRGRLVELSSWLVVPVCLTLAYAALHAEARYTLPARPVLWLLGGVALQRAWERWGPARQRAASPRQTSTVAATVRSQP